MDEMQFQMFVIKREKRHNDVLDDLTNALLNLRFFKKLKKKNPFLVRKCAQYIELHHYKYGDIVYSCGDKSTDFYNVIKGELNMIAPQLQLQTSGSQTPRSQTLENLSPQRLSPEQPIQRKSVHFRERHQKQIQQRINVIKHIVEGDFFGEQGLLTHKRTLTVVCTSDVMMLQLGKAYYEELIGDFDIEKERTERHVKFSAQLFNSIILKQSQMLQIYMCFEKHIYLTNQFLFQEGDIGDCIYVVKLGEIMLLKCKKTQIQQPKLDEIVSPAFQNSVKTKRVNMGPLEFAVISSGFIGEEYVESLINENSSTSTELINNDFIRTYSAQCKSVSKIFKLNRSSLMNILQSSSMRDFFLQMISKKTSWRNNFLQMIIETEPQQKVKDIILLRDPLRPLKYREEMTNLDPIIVRQSDVIRSKKFINDYSPYKEGKPDTPVLNLVILQQIKRSQILIPTTKREQDNQSLYSKSLAKLLSLKKIPSIVQPFMYFNTNNDSKEPEQSALLLFQKSRLQKASLNQKITVAAFQKLCSKTCQKMNAQEYLGVPKKQTKSIFQEVQIVVNRMRLKNPSQTQPLNIIHQQSNRRYVSCRSSPYNQSDRAQGTPQKQIIKYFPKKVLKIVDAVPLNNNYLIQQKI